MALLNDGQRCVKDWRQSELQQDDLTCFDDLCRHGWCSDCVYFLLRACAGGESSSGNAEGKLSEHRSAESGGVVRCCRVKSSNLQA